jgi:1,4-dihydroxy-2-naphthoate octaprenyltransferase
MNRTWPIGAAKPTRLGIWIQAIRPKTLSASVVPVLIGTGLARGQGLAKPVPAIAALCGALLIQIGTNLANDYYDFQRGADTADRLGPVRVTQSGLIAPGLVLWAALACFSAATLVGLYLVAIGGWSILVVGLLSILSGLAYTAGPVPLAYVGLGDLFVLLFFGFVAVGGAYYVQAGHLTSSLWLAALPAGALSTAILAVNNLRDAGTDGKAGKRTLVVRFGATAGKIEYCLMLLAAFAAPIVLWVLGLSGAGVLLSLLALPLAAAPLRRVLVETGRALNPALGGTARAQLVFGVLFAIGLGSG